MDYIHIAKTDHNVWPVSLLAPQGMHLLILDIPVFEGQASKTNPRIIASTFSNRFDFPNTVKIRSLFKVERSGT